ncbi:MAG: hypothetical protein H7Z14_07090 [Anaerolineae bacterium]|nr:hypothetical protein [Phycisphaerae bacterium]
MKLETESGGTFNEPQVSDLSAAIRSLDTDGSTWAILSKERNDFVQVRRATQQDYRVEYHDPNSDDHFAAPESLTIEQAQRLFADFHAGGTHWKTMATFQPTELKSRSGCAGRSAAAIAVVLGLGIWVATRQLF